MPRFFPLKFSLTVTMVFWLPWQIRLWSGQVRLLLQPNQIWKADKGYLKVLKSLLNRGGRERQAEAVFASHAL